MQLSHQRYLFFSFVTLMMGLIWIINPVSVHAQLYKSATVATTHVVSNGKPQPGDIISYNKNTHIFSLTHIPYDRNVFGIVVKNPILLISDNSNGVPITTSGEVLVNVTTKNGPINIGDYITSSSIIGKGQRAGSTTPYVIGIALTAFPKVSSSTPLHTKKIYEGTIRLFFNSEANPLMIGTIGTQQMAVGKSIIFHIIKYVLAAIVAIGTIYVAFRTSGLDMRSSIISIGRNPMAKSSIRSMLILDTVIIILVSLVGLAIALALVFIPV